MYRSTSTSQIRLQGTMEEETPIKMEKCETCHRLFCLSALKKHKKFENCRAKDKIAEEEPVPESKIIKSDQPDEKPEKTVKFVNDRGYSDEPKSSNQSDTVVSEEKTCTAKVERQMLEKVVSSNDTQVTKHQNLEEKNIQANKTLVGATETCSIVDASTPVTQVTPELRKEETQHIRTSPQVSKGRSKVCPSCRRPFPTRELMLKHKREKHRFEYPFSCHACLNVYQSKHSLLRHQDKESHVQQQKNQDKTEDRIVIVQKRKSPKKENYAPDPTSPVNNADFRRSERAKKPRLVYTPSKSPSKENMKPQQQDEQVHLPSTPQNPSPKSDKTKRNVFTNHLSPTRKVEGEELDHNFVDSHNDNSTDENAQVSSATSSVICHSYTDSSINEGRQEPEYHGFLPVVPVNTLQLYQYQQRLDELLKQTREENQRYTNANALWNPSFFLHMNRYNPKESD